MPSFCWGRKGEPFGKASLKGDTWEGTLHEEEAFIRQRGRGGRDIWGSYGVPCVLYENVISIFPEEGHSVPFKEEQQRSERLSPQAGNHRAGNGSQICDLGEGGRRIFPLHPGGLQKGERELKTGLGVVHNGRGEGTGKKSGRPGATQGAR